MTIKLWTASVLGQDANTHWLIDAPNAYLATRKAYRLHREAGYANGEVYVTCVRTYMKAVRVGRQTAIREAGVDTNRYVPALPDMLADPDYPDVVIANEPEYTDDDRREEW